MLGSQRGTVGGAPNAACSASIRCEAIDSVVDAREHDEQGPEQQGLV